MAAEADRRRPLNADPLGSEMGVLEHDGELGFGLPELQVTQSPRIGVLPATAAAIVAFALLFSGRVGWLMVLLAFGYLAQKSLTARRRRTLAGSRLTLTPSAIVLDTPDPLTGATIDLHRPFAYRYLEKEREFAVYQLRQEGVRLLFASDTPGAAPVVRNVLRAEWPPQDRSFFIP